MKGGAILATPLRCITMKINKKVFIFSFISSICVVLIVFLFLLYNLRPIMEYEVSTVFTIESNKKILSDSTYFLSELKKVNDEIELEVSISNNNERSVSYETIALVNNEQIFVDGKSDVIKLKIKSNCIDSSVIKIKEDLLRDSVNEILVIFRQDVDIHSNENELLADSNTIIRRYILIDDLVRDKDMETDEDLAIEKTTLNNENDSIQVSPLNMENKLGLNVNKDSTISFEIDTRFQNGKIEYKLFCLQNSRLTNINDAKYVIIDGGEKTKVEVGTQNKRGNYELEFIAVPCCYDEKGELSVISSNRYTLEVE